MEKHSVDTEQKKCSLVLAGGGIRLAYHAGVMIALEEAGISFTHIDGTSGGIFGTAMIASGIKPQEAAERWRKLNLNGFVSLMPIKNYINPLRSKAAGGTTGIRKKIFPALGIDVEKIRKSTLASTFNICNFSNKTVESIPNTTITEDHLIAGMSLPLFMPAIKIGQDWYTDAVWIKDANLLEAVKHQAEEIWLVWCIGNNSKYLDGPFLQYVHMIEMSASAGLFGELEWIQEINEERVQKGISPIIVHIIKPEYPLPLDPDFFTGKINADTLINMGYADTMKYLSNQIPFNFNQGIPSATKMKEPGEYIHFRKTYRGKIAIQGERRDVKIHLAYFIRRIESKLVTQLYSSISINNEPFLSGYDNQFYHEAIHVFKSKFKVTYNQINYIITIEDQMHNTIDLLLGLEFKTCRVSLENDNENTVAKFTQSAKARLKNALYTHTSAQTGWWKKQLIKKRILTQLIYTPFNQTEYEV